MSQRLVPLLLSTDEAMQVLGVGRSTFLELVYSGAVESVKVGRRRLIPTEALEDYVAALRSAS